MKLFRFTVISFFLVAGLGPLIVAQQPSPSTPGPAPQIFTPNLMRFSGTIKDEVGPQLPRTLGITFALHADAQTPTSLWIETQNVQLDASGHYSVLLGSTTASGLPIELFTNNEAHWLGVHVQGVPDPPRIMLVSVPYAFAAQNAETLGGLPASAFVLRAVPVPIASANSSSDLAPKVGSMTDLTRPVVTFGGVPSALAKFGAPAEVFPSAISENQGVVDVAAAQSNLAFHGRGAHSIAFVGDRSATVGESAALGAYFSSNSPGAPMRFFVSDIAQHEALHIAPNGNISIGSGMVQQIPAGANNVFSISQGNGHAIADGWDTYSSARWKTDIQTMDGALAKVLQLRGVSYEYTPTQKRDIGMIAEEVGRVVPEVVTYETNGIDAQSIDYARLTAVLVEAVKEQQQEIRRQQTQLQHLKAVLSHSADNKK
jgi:hypothetical protein